MKSILCLLFLIVVVDKGQPPQLQIGQRLNKDIVIISKDKLVMTNSGTIEKTYLIAFQGHRFNIVLKNNKTIKFIFTNDKGFATEDGIKIGMKYGQIKDRLVATTPSLQIGWANYFVSKTGWNVAFNYDSIIDDQSTVQFLFK